MDQSIALTAIESDDEATDDEHFIRLRGLGETHERGSENARHIVHKQAAFSAQRKTNSEIDAINK